ncbi:hypothetical protein [Candidatus Neptunochlamydia vexilliferae]|nr:hypothetical protein [Candidatus Neptunochlamydia vexilliferae]
MKAKDEELIRKLGEEFKDDIEVIKMACEQDLEEENSRIAAAYQRGL